MRYLGHQFEHQSRQQRLKHYRAHPCFAHLQPPEEVQQQADPTPGEDGKKKLEHRAIWQVDESDLSGRAELRIVGPLDSWFGFYPDEIIEQLDSQSDLQHIHLVISSPGGYIELAQTLYSDLRRRARQGTKITSEGLALVASAGLDLFLAGDERTASDDTVMMQHPIEGFTFLQGAKPEIEQQYKELMSQMDAYISLNHRIFAERTGQPTEVLDQWLLQPGEIWFSVDQAYDAGLLTQKPDTDSGTGTGDDSDEALMQQASSRFSHMIAALEAA